MDPMVTPAQMQNMSSIADSAKNTQKYYDSRGLNDFSNQMFDDPNLGYGNNYLANNHSILGNNLNSIDIARHPSNP